MSIIPQGLPAWLRANDFQAYGGDLNKKNFASRGAVNPKTDVDAEAFSRITADLAALSRTAPFCVMVVRNNTVSVPPTVEFISMMTGTRTSSYEGDAPPAGFPAVADAGTGTFIVTFDTEYADEFGVVGALTLTQPMAQLLGSVPGFCTVELLSASEVQVYSFDNTGTALAETSVTLTLGSGA